MSALSTLNDLRAARTRLTAAEDAFDRQVRKAVRAEIRRYHRHPGRFRIDGRELGGHWPLEDYDERDRRIVTVIFMKLRRRGSRVPIKDGELRRSDVAFLQEFRQRLRKSLGLGRAAIIRVFVHPAYFGK